MPEPTWAILRTWLARTCSREWSVEYPIRSMPANISDRSSRGRVPTPATELSLAERARMMADTSMSRNSSASTITAFNNGMAPPPVPPGPDSDARSVAAFIRAGGLDRPEDESFCGDSGSNDPSLGLNTPSRGVYKLSHKMPVSQVSAHERRSLSNMFMHADGAQIVSAQHALIPATPRRAGSLSMAAAPPPPTPRKIEIAPDPAWLSKTASGYKPTLDEVFEALPFAELCRGMRPCFAGVLRIANVSICFSAVQWRCRSSH